MFAIMSVGKKTSFTRSFFCWKLNGLLKGEKMESIEKQWYVLHTYSGYENKVKANLESRTETMNMQDYIYRVVVPENEVTTIKDGQEKTTIENDFPGYVLVEMVMGDAAWFVVRNTPGVTGFVGSHGGGSKPTPLLPDEVENLMSRMGITSRRVEKLELEIGETITIIAGPFNGMQGVVTAIDQEKEQLSVNVEVFGRETPTELAFADIDKLEI